MVNMASPHYIVILLYFVDNTIIARVLKNILLLFTLSVNG